MKVAHLAAFLAAALLESVAGPGLLLTDRDRHLLIH